MFTRTWRAAGSRLALFTAVSLAIAGCSALNVATGPTVTPATTATAGAGTGTPGNGGAPAWTSVVVAQTTTRGGTLTISNLNPISGHLVAITTASPADKVTLDGVSPNGQLLAFHTDDGTGNNAFTIAHVDGSGAKVVGQVSNPLGHAVWSPDSAHLAVGTQSHGIVALDIATGHVSNLISQDATLIAYAPDGASLFGVGTGTTLPPGAVTRLPLDGTKPVALTPRLTGNTFALTPDGKTLYYQNSGPAGSPGIFSVATSDGSGSSTPLRTGTDVPVGFTASGAPLVFRGLPTPELLRLGATASADVVVANPLPADFTLPESVTDVIVAPDGNGVIVLGQPQTGTGYSFFFTDLAAPGGTPKVATAFPTAVQADFGGWDTLIIPSGS